MKLHQRMVGLATIVVMGLVSGCSGNGERVVMEGPSVMGLPPFGVTIEGFVKALPSGVSAIPRDDGGLKSLTLPKPMNVYGAFKSDQLVAQFGSADSPDDKFWKLVAVAKLPWMCSSEDIYTMLKEVEPNLKRDFEFTETVPLSDGSGASVSGISKERMLIASVTCSGYLMLVVYQFTDVKLFSYHDSSTEAYIAESYARNSAKSVQSTK